jgi:hypothetical protein
MKQQENTHTVCWICCTDYVSALVIDAERLQVLELV